jgi:hypothetical protein
LVSRLPKVKTPTQHTRSSSFTRLPRAAMSCSWPHTTTLVTRLPVRLCHAAGHTRQLSSHACPCGHVMQLATHDNSRRTLARAAMSCSWPHTTTLVSMQACISISASLYPIPDHTPLPLVPTSTPAVPPRPGCISVSHSSALVNFRTSCPHSPAVTQSRSHAVTQCFPVLPCTSLCLYLTLTRSKPIDPLPRCYPRARARRAAGRSGSPKLSRSTTTCIAYCPTR